MQRYALVMACLFEHIELKEVRDLEAYLNWTRVASSILSTAGSKIGSDTDRKLFKYSRNMVDVLQGTAELCNRLYIRCRRWTVHNTFLSQLLPNKHLRLVKCARAWMTMLFLRLLTVKRVCILCG